MSEHNNVARWYLIQAGDVAKIRGALLAPTHAINEYPNCEDWPKGYGCDGCRGDKLREEAVHTLDTGLNITDVFLQTGRATKWVKQNGSTIPVSLLSVIALWDC